MVNRLHKYYRLGVDRRVLYPLSVVFNPHSNHMRQALTPLYISLSASELQVTTTAFTYKLVLFVIYHSFLYGASFIKHLTYTRKMY